MSQNEFQYECVRCGKIMINGYWYHPQHTPPHEVSYQGALCPVCKEKRKLAVISPEQPDGQTSK